MFEFLRLNLQAFFGKEEGVSSLEYAVLAVVILAAILVVVKTNGIETLFTKMSQQIANVNDKVSVGS